MTGPDPRQLIEDNSDADLVEILRALAASGCTGSLAVSSAENAGVIFMEDGQVVDALVNDGSWLGEGIPAVAFLTNLAYPELRFSEGTDFSQRTIRLDIDHLVELVEQARPLLLPPVQTPAQPQAEAAGEGAAPAPAHGAQAEPPPPVAAPGPPQPEARVEDPLSGAEALFSALRSVRGYLGATLMGPSGVVLAQDPEDGGAAAISGPVFHQILRLTQDATEELGLGPCSELTVSTPSGTIIAHCSGGPDPTRMLCMIAPRGNTALAGLRLAAALPEPRPRRR